MHCPEDLNQQAFFDLLLQWQARLTAVVVFPTPPFDLKLIWCKSTNLVYL